MRIVWKPALERAEISCFPVTLGSVTIGYGYALNTDELERFRLTALHLKAEFDCFADANH